MNILWGHGEKWGRIIYSCLVMIPLIAGSYSFFYDVSFFDALYETVAYFFGKQYSTAMPIGFSITLICLQYLTFGSLIAVIVRRLSSR